MRRVPLGGAVSDRQWFLALMVAYKIIIRESGFSCMEVQVNPKTFSIVIVDPHRHLHSPAGRATLRETIHEVCDPKLRSKLELALLGDATD
jgi:hypothetical protein